MADLSAFSSEYREAREKFLDAAGAQVSHHAHPEKGLYLDVAVVGARDAERVFAVGCGTHGIEGYPGSAALTQWLRGGAAKRVPPGTAVVLFHAHNPWGFAHKTRVTEENVDLNRNFVDFSNPLPANPGYDELHRAITPAEWTEESVAGAFKWLAEYKARVGEQAYSDAFNGGQYSHADGVYYGGARQQWANGAFRLATKEHLSRAKKICFIDLHTGIGPRYDHIYLCFHPAGSPGYERARAWWGERAVNRQGVTHKALAVYRGLLIDAFEAMLANAELTTMVVEFGTLAREGVQRAALLQRWLRFEGPGRPELIREYEEAYYPLEPRWRELVLQQSYELFERGLKGVSGW
ncbi:MAG TPA: M14 family metallopeptidase [Burkholderiales bacterium]|nr:M14 family metallopeptidase [Burkholderiales bacterium]